MLNKLKGMTKTDLKKHIPDEEKMEEKSEQWDFYFSTIFSCLLENEQTLDQKKEVLMESAELADAALLEFEGRWVGV